MSEEKTKLLTNSINLNSIHKRLPVHWTWPAYLYISFDQVHTLSQGGSVYTWSHPPRILQTRCFFCCSPEILRWSTGQTLSDFTNTTWFHLIKIYYACFEPRALRLISLYQLLYYGEIRKIKFFTVTDGHDSIYPILSDRSEILPADLSNIINFRYFLVWY